MLIRETALWTVVGVAVLITCASGPAYAGLVGLEAICDRLCDPEMLEGECPPGQVWEEDGCRSICELETICFDFDEYSINAMARQVLLRNAECIKELGDVSIVLEGHTDERGTDEYNLPLSEKYAVSVRKFLAKQGIDEERMETRGYGEDRPTCTESTEECWARNRRVEFRVEAFEPVAEPVEDLSAVGGSPADEAISGCLLEPVYFDFDSTQIGASQRDVLAANAQCIQKLGPGVEVVIIGLDDPRGTEEYRIAVAQKRAHAVKKYLENQAVPSEKLNIQVEIEGPCAEENEACWVHWRKVDFQIIETE